MESAHSCRPVGTFRSYDPLDGIVFAKGEGLTLWDTDGKSYMDFISGYSASNLGHSHPELVRAVVSQVNELTFCTNANTLVRKELERALADLWRKSKNSPTADSVAKVWLGSSGARAVEVAWKLAYANRPGILMRFDLAYHGRSLATAHISDTRASDALRRQFGVGLGKPEKDEMGMEPSAGIIPFPCCGTTSKEACEQCDASLAATRRWLELHAHKTSAMIVEPVIGSRGYYFACRNFLRRLADVLREYQIQIISDEIQMGLGRLGKMLVSHEDGWDADFTVLGKSLGGGVVSMAAVIGHAKKMDALVEGIESETFAANPLGCRVAVGSLRLLNDERLMRDVVVNGESFRDRLHADLPEFLKVDGLGLATVIDLSEVPSDVGIASKVAYSWVSQMKECGMLTHLTGARRDRIAFIPPLVIDGASLERATNIAVDFWNSGQNLPSVPPAKYRPFMESAS